MSLLGQIRHDVNTSWTPEAPPDYIPADTVYFDFEATGLRWWDTDKPDRPVGLAVAWWDGDLLRSQYLPWAHAGGNLPEDAVKRFVRHALAGKRLVGSKISYDAHMARVWDVDLEALGCILGDVGHQAALLDDNRRRFGLEPISQQYLGTGKLEMLDVTRMASLHASEVASYACRDVELPAHLERVFWPMLEGQELHPVRELEEEVAWATIEMEQNGVLIDVPRLHQWRREVDEIILKLLWEITLELGFKFELGEKTSLKKAFDKLGLKNPYRTAVNDDESFTDAVLEKYDHPTVMKIRLALEYRSLKVKFLDNWARKVDRYGILRYALHQVACDEGGTVTGRFSSSGMTSGRDGEGVNIQQTAKPSKQKIRFGTPGKPTLLDKLRPLCPYIKEFIVRDLVIPAKGLWYKADAKQVEYRLFAHYSNSPKILAVYADNPEADFHNTVMEMVQKTKDINRDKTKDLNFAMIFGAGMKKIAVMLGFRSPTEPDESMAGVREVRPFVEAYDRAFPEAKKLLREASTLAETRGYVKTIYGRRARFPGGKFSHKALNRVIQGSNGDIHKIKLCEVKAASKKAGFTMRLTMHDEVGGDIQDAEGAKMLSEILDRQSIETRVPILWDSTTGPTWGACK